MRVKLKHSSRLRSRQTSLPVLVGEHQQRDIDLTRQRPMSFAD